jgi:hypothetical protein
LLADAPVPPLALELPLALCPGAPLPVAVLVEAFEGALAVAAFWTEVFPLPGVLDEVRLEGLTDGDVLVARGAVRAFGTDSVTLFPLPLEIADAGVPAVCIAEAAT